MDIIEIDRSDNIQQVFADDDDCVTCAITEDVKAMI